MFSFLAAISQALTTRRLAARQRRWSGAALALVLLATAVAGFSDTRPAGTGSVQAELLNLRPEPGDQRPPITQLVKGTRLEILSQSDGWLQVRVDGKTGWVRNRPRYVKVEKPAAAIENYRREAQDLQRRIEDSRARVTAFDRREDDVLAALRRVDRALNDSRRRAAGLTRDTRRLEGEMAAAARELDALTHRTARREHHAGLRLAALYKLGRLGGLQPLFSSRSVAELQRRRYALQGILNQDRRLLDELIADSRKLEEMQTRRRKDEARLTALRGDLGKELAEAAGELRRRKRLLKEIRSRRKLELASIESLKTAARSLNEKFRRYNRSLQSGSEGKSPLAAMAGLLKMPVEGKVINFFGSYHNARFDVENFRSGVDIRADRGEPVRAVLEGKVLFSDWFEGYGNMIIIDHGGGDYSVYAHMEEMFKAAAERVETGEVIATVGETGSSQGPLLYFEIRHDGKPENPLDWIRPG